MSQGLIAAAREPSPQVGLLGVAMSLSRAFALAFTILICPSVTAVSFAADLSSMGPPVRQVFPPAPCGGPCASAPAPAIPYRPLLPVGAMAVAPAPIAVDHWDTNGFGDCRYPGDYFGACGGFFGRCGWFSGPGPCGAPAPCGACGRPAAYRPAPSPVYIVNQGPEYSGPGFMILFKTYSPSTGLAAPGQFPYISARHVYRPPLGVRG